MKRTRLRRRSKRPARSLEIIADGLWSKVILSLTGNHCARCAAYGCHAAHIVGRDNRHLRHHPKNGVPLCPPCHNWADNVNPKAFMAWLEQVCPDRFAMVKMQWEDKGPFKIWMLEERIEELKGML